MTSALSQCIEWVACRAGIFFYIFLSSKDKHETHIQCETCVTKEDTEKNTVTHCSLACVSGGGNNGVWTGIIFSVSYPIVHVHNSFA